MGISKGYDDETLKRVQEVQLGILKSFISFCDKHDLHYFMTYGSALGTVRHHGFIPWDDDIDVGMLRPEYERFLELFAKEGIENLEILTPLHNEAFASRVTHLQRKDTTFISEYSKDLKCHTGINMDIFIYDKVSNDPKSRKKQFHYTYLLGKLLFLKGTANPNIPAKGLKGKLYHAACIVIHHFLNLFRIKASSIYKKMMRYAMSASHEDSAYVAHFGGYRTEIGVFSVADDIFPLRKMKYEEIEVNVIYQVEKFLTIFYGEKYMEMPPVELQVNHYPYKIEFGDYDE